MPKVIIPVASHPRTGRLLLILSKRAALDSAIRQRYKDIIWRLNAVAIRFKHRFPLIIRNIRVDMAYMKRKYRPNL